MWQLAFAVSLLIFRSISEDVAGAQRGAAARSAQPRTEEGSIIPLIYGTCRVRSPVVLWAGNWFPAPAGGQFTYTLSMLWGIGVPFFDGFAELASIYAGTNLLELISGIAGDTHGHPGRHPFTTNSGSEMFGGPGKGGGIDGFVEFFDGRRFQQISDGLNDGNDRTYVEEYQTGDTPASPAPGYQTSSIDASLIPGYRGIALAFMFIWEIGEAPNMLPYSFIVKSLSALSASDLGNSLTDDADPAAVIYDLLTSPWGKLGLPTTKVDLASFQAASLTLFNEGHGYSRSIEAAEEATSIVQDVLHQIGGVLYEEPETGKIELHLIRNDYSLPALEDINPNNAVLSNYSIQSSSETINQVRVKFTDRANAYADGVVIGQNGANVVKQGGRLRSMDVDYPGCCVRDLAQKLASRDLAAVSRPMAVATVVTNRSFYRARPGVVYTLTWPSLGISGMVMRVAHVDLGQLHTNAIRIELVRDMFDVNLGAFPS